MRSLLLAVLLVGCARRTPNAMPMEAPPPASVDDWGESPAYDEAPPAKSEMGRSGGGRGASADMPPPPPPPPPGMAASPARPAQAPAPSPEPAAQVVQERMIHYTGYARIRATQVHDTLTEVARIALDAGGRVERLSGNAITVRVPVGLFDAKWKEVLGLGDVLDQNVSAEDVTDAFTEVDLRVHILTVTRDRLVELLAKAETEDEKIALLREIQNVTEQLDQFQEQLRTLRGLADYSQITVEVVAREAVASGGGSGPTVAGMAWIAALSPFRRDVGADPHRVDLPVPSGLVSLSPRGPFAAESPEGVVVWTGRLDNDPRADADFWVEAIRGRLSSDFASGEAVALGAWRCVELVDASEEPYTWDVCVQVDPVDRKLWLGQVYYPSTDARERYRAAVEASFRGGAS